MFNVVYYARVSTEEEEQLNALENQRSMLEDFINSNSDWMLVGSYIDEGKTGTTAKGRNEYNKLLQDLETDKFDIVVIKDLSRLNRNTFEYYKFIDALVNNEKKLYIYTDNKFYESDDKLLNGIKAMLAEEYSRDISKKVNAGHKQRAKKGIPLTNGKLWGYNQERGSKQLTINEEEAEIVKKIFNWYIEGKGFRIIYKLLEGEGIKNRNGKPFSITTLKRMIKNEKYIGTLISNKTHKDFDTKKIKLNPESEWIIHKDIIPPIITEEVFNKANKILDSKRSKNPDKSKNEYIGYFQGTQTYSGKIICGECGRPYWHTLYRNKSLWLCSEYKSFGLKKEGKEHGCVNHKIRTEELDKVVKELIFNMLNNNNGEIEELIKILNSVLEDNNSVNNIKKLEQKKDKLESKKSKFIDMMAEELITKEEFMRKKKELDDQIEKINEELNVLTVKNDDIYNKKEKLFSIQKHLEKKFNSPDDIDDELIKEFIDKIIVKNKNEVEIYFNFGDNSINKNYQTVSIIR